VQEYDLRQSQISAEQLAKVLEAGNNITLTVVNDCTLRIDASGSGGPSTGTKYHLKDGDDITVLDCFEYLICGTFILDTLARFTINTGARLAVIEGPILNDGVITNNGVIKNGIS
jgi:hypothetical protein